MERIQKLADEHHIGIEIVKVMILDSHPPVEKVAPRVPGCDWSDGGERGDRAESGELRGPDGSGGGGRGRADPGRSDLLQLSHEDDCGGGSGTFNTQLVTYRIMPRMFRLKAYLDLLENDCRDIRKFIIASGLDNEVYQLNFETKQQLDLIDVDASALGGN